MVKKKITDEELIYLRRFGFKQCEIAKMKDMKQNVIYRRSRKLVKEGYLKSSKGIAPYEFLKARKKFCDEKKRERIDRILSVLKKKGNAMPAMDLMKEAKIWSLTDLARKGILVPIRFSLKRGTGSFSRNPRTYEIIKEEYCERTYYCLNNRTVIVRLITKALRKPNTVSKKKSVMAFLRKYLSNAERIAVMWRLGCRTWDRTRVPSSIQVNGVLMPRGKFKIGKGRNL